MLNFWSRSKNGEKDRISGRGWLEHLASSRFVCGERGGCSPWPWAQHSRLNSKTHRTCWIARMYTGVHPCEHVSIQYPSLAGECVLSKVLQCCIVRAQMSLQPAYGLRGCHWRGGDVVSLWLYCFNSVSFAKTSLGADDLWVGPSLGALQWFGKVRRLWVMCII